MKITIEKYEQTVTFEEPANDQTAEDMVIAYAGLLVAIGYDQELVRQSIVEGL